MLATVAKRTTIILKRTNGATTSNTTPFTCSNKNNHKPELIRKERFQSENFPYDAETDIFLCPAKQRLTYQTTRRQRTENGYRSEICIYAASACNSCPLKPECTPAQGNRRLYVSLCLRRYREQVRTNLLSEQSKPLRIRHNVEVESVFGHIKRNKRAVVALLRALDYSQVNRD